MTSSFSAFTLTHLSRRNIQDYQSRIALLKSVVRLLNYIRLTDNCLYIFSFQKSLYFSVYLNLYSLLPLLHQSPNHLKTNCITEGNCHCSKPQRKNFNIMTVMVLLLLMQKLLIKFQTISPREFLQDKERGLGNQIGKIYQIP